ncbi:MAG TPA: protein kinase [Mesorhizobium sp.]|jgi:serine/threonine-protein kinase|uniref:serine/threonine-protein kinase n=1 Tax=Mesorhizobium sp. TaxID=1871066 RepID=UPI002DDD566E|nr:protein kinase [Mesorhizobium sp.]HEV2507829.1 protein kinase [Mesorhizobium sp.]
MSDDDKTRISTNVAYAGVGTQLSAIYELDERIASGGMGEVYRGHNIQTGDHVAIKIVLPEFARDQTILSLFRKEASILNHLSHDAVVRYHVFTIDPGIGRPYLAMEFVDGQSLFDIIRLGAMPPQEVRRLCHRLASGLSAVHQAGAIHRDLSPDNIILPGGRVDRAKIIDFGIARSATVGGETLIGGKFAGKYNYVSPEQLGLFGGEVSEQSDIYSLGLVLAAALRGKPLDMSGSQYEVIEKRRTVPDLSDIDPDFRDLLEAMLQPDPHDRPASMAEIARATRDEDLDTTSPPALFGARERSGLPPASRTSPPDTQQAPPPSSAEQRFVQHVRPAHLSEPGAASAPVAASPSTLTAQPNSARMPMIAGGAIVLALFAAMGLYFSGALAPSPTSGKVADNNPTKEPAQIPTGDSKTAEAQKLEQPAKPPATKAPETNQTGTDTGPVSDTKPIATKPDIPDSDDNPPKLPKANTPSSPTAESHKPVEPETPSGPTKPQPPATKPQENNDVVVNLPKPDIPSTNKVDEMAQRTSWVRDFSGGDCFYASLTSATDGAAAIEGFGTAVQPFERMLADFQSRFHLEPEISVRLIAPPQCEVTRFLRFFDRNSAERPQLVLDRTSVPDGSPISGSLITGGGLVSNVMLIDHKGIAFNLDDRMVTQTDKAAFSIPIGLGASDKAAGKAVPQIMLVITGPRDVQAAVFSRPTPASELLPRILKEIGADGAQFSATARYFRLGG